jgi:GH25 family lysozyme M1 (1,4-beta-N-acetylmuramidase)
MSYVERIFLVLIIGICFLISLVIIDSLVDPSLLVETVSAKFDSNNQNMDLFLLNRSSEPDTDQGDPLLLQDNWEVFTSEGYAFEIRYPVDYVTKLDTGQKSLNVRLEMPENTPVWQFNLIKPEYYQGTNLVNAGLVIQVARGPDAVSGCSLYKSKSLYQQKGSLLPEKTINSIPYVVDVVNEGVMGGFYQRISYRTVFQSACYEITQIIQTTNLDNFPLDTIQAFPEDQVLEQLDQILDTFKFLDIEATFPEPKYPDKSSPTGKSAIEKNAAGYADGIDVSHWQEVIDWNQVAGAGYSFAFVKGTEGVGWTDSKFFTNIESGEAAGLYLGVYHFARPDLDNTGQEEAEYFLSVVGDYIKSGYLRPVLDLEVGGSLGRETISAWVMEWMQTVENQTGVAPLIYTNLYYINSFLSEEVTAYDLWIAYWNCDPTVTSTIPPTGIWDDWAFWQYCVGNPGTVPGISTRIDLDIYDGLESNLNQYDSASQLWVYLSADKNLAPAPYNADLVANVNGDASGLINYYFWWDCSSLETDIESVEADCGVLPESACGYCVHDDRGMKCLAMKNELLMAEHLYLDIDNYSPKVIVEREEGIAEDRFQITAFNPITSISPNPPSPGNGLLEVDFTLAVDITTNTSVAGILQAEIYDDETSTLIDSACVNVPGATISTSDFSFQLPYSINGSKTYTIWARYRTEGSCPVLDIDGDDISEEYEVQWPLITTDQIGLYDPASGSWALKESFTSTWQDVNWFIFGPDGEDRIPISGDWDGDGVDTIGLYNPQNSSFSLKSNNNGGWENVTWFIFGPTTSGETIPIAGDWDGDGIDTVGLYDPVNGEWFLKSENTGGWENVTSFLFGPGGVGRIPIIGDWDGDQTDTIGLYAPDNSSFSLKSENNPGWENVNWFVFGPAYSGRFPLAGDWNRDGYDTIGLFDQIDSRWFLKPENVGGWQGVTIFKFGPEDAGRIPIIGSWIMDAPKP